jgi:hypothetical protein
LATDQQIRELCEQLRLCKDDAECIALLSELRLSIHEYIENLPDKVLGFPLAVNPKDKKAS